MCWAEDELARVEARCQRAEDEAADAVCRLADLIDDFDRGLVSADELRRHASDARRRMGVLV